MMEEAEDGDSFDILVNDKVGNFPAAGSMSPRPDVISNTNGSQFISLDIYGDSDESNSLERTDYSSRDSGSELIEKVKSFVLMDEQENIQLKTADVFCTKLKVAPEAKIKVVSIFGNSGDGKSHTMNHTFFGGKEVFKTSNQQGSCTMGIWAAFNRHHNVLCLDTEGLLGETTNENKQMRMLLKVLAVSDIIIYRTRTERLRLDMYNFLGNASTAFSRYFSSALQSLKFSEIAQFLGPAVIVFHETQNTEVLKEDYEGRKEEEILRERFAKMKLELTAFSSLRYVGVQTNKKNSTNYEPLKIALERELRNTTIRSPRHPKVVFETLKALNKKFNGELSSVPHNAFPEQYFSCTTVCKSCLVQCQLSMGHLTTGESHRHADACKYQHQFQNDVQICSKCFTNGREMVLSTKKPSSNDSSWSWLAKYTWQGWEIECPHCGVVSGQVWYDKSALDPSIGRKVAVHVWNDDTTAAGGTANTAQQVLEGVAYITEAVASVGAQPARTIMNWMSDKVRPDYWEPDNLLITCRGCNRPFDDYNVRKHHCRDCGKGFCNSCSLSRMPVYHRGWNSPVRVCDNCRNKLAQAQRHGQENSAVQAFNDSTEQDPTSSTGNSQSGDAEVNVTARKYGEVFINTIVNFGVALEYPKDLIKDSVRPAYWVPDAKVVRCHLCKLLFGPAEETNSTNAIAQAGPSSNDNNVPDQLLAAMADDTSPSPSHSSSQNIDRRIHHCRACGNAVCESCSEHRRPVPTRGWPKAVRVCNNCVFSND